jgi:uncharacterized membrane protein
MLLKLKQAVVGQKDLRRSDRWIFGTMALSASLSLIAAFALSVDAIQLAKNPDAILNCNLNAVINCATVNKTPEASLFGFPNSFLGLVSEPIVLTVALAGLMGVRFPRLFMFTAQIFYTLGLVFALWLFQDSVFYIGALCPWCLLVTVSTIVVFSSLLRYNLRENNLFLSEKYHKKMLSFIHKDYDTLLTASVIFSMAALIIVKYGDGLFG